MIKKVEGILVVPKKTNSAKKLDFDIWVTTSSPSNPFFFSNPAIREAISSFSSHGALRSTQLGELNYFKPEFSELVVGKKIMDKISGQRLGVELKEKPVYMYDFLPFQSEFVQSFSERSKDKFYFEKKGISLFAERIALRELLKVAPNAILVPHLGMTNPRMNQLKNRGMKIERVSQIISAREMLQAITRHIREHRIKNRPKSSTQRLIFALNSGKKLRRRR
jgi:hypothetical protein